MGGVTNYRKTFIIGGGDYSYGIYLYHTTLQQAIVSLGILTWYAVFMVSLPLVTVVAAMSWRLVEKPALSLRAYLTRRSSPRQAPVSRGPDRVEEERFAGQARGVAPL
jgi:peptidoglycan/LPS O-acetylase OafA/YrhL